MRPRTRLKVHPGEILKLEFLEPVGMSATALARELDVPANRMSELGDPAVALLGGRASSSG